jgi:hypothetical protein
LKSVPLLPTAEVSLLLAAAVLDGKRARESWERWQAPVIDVRQTLAADPLVARPLLPLLYDSAQRNGLQLDAATSTYLRSALLSERLRSETYRSILSEVTSRLTDAGVPFLTVKGAAVGQLYYSQFALRHAHDIEIVATDRRAVLRVVGKAGFRPVGPQLIHESGLPLRIHRPAALWRSDALRQDVWKTAQLLPTGARTLDPTHTLLLTLTNAAIAPSRGSGRWMCDARFIIVANRIDWSRFADAVSEAEAALTTVCQLLWLRGTVDVEVPEEVIDAIGREARSAGRRQRAIIEKGLTFHSEPLWWRLRQRFLR